ncbi:MAG: cytidylyltransferase domain-containing protein [bacterium]
MYQGKSFLAIIPARGGSKRLPRKNVLPLAGRPLIGWSIQAALESRYIDRVIVSSDDGEILGLAEQLGAEALLRPIELAADDANTIDVLIHAVTKAGHSYDHVVLLQATSPLRGANHIDEAVEYMLAIQAGSVISVTEAEHSPLWANVLPEDGCLRSFIRDDVVGKRSQDLDTYYRLNGSIYIAKTDRLISSKSLMFDDSYAYVMSRECSIDIDTLYDFICAEALINYQSTKLVT